MIKEDIEKLEEKEYLFTVECDGVIYKDVVILNNATWRSSINENYKILSFKETNTKLE